MADIALQHASVADIWIEPYKGTAKRAGNTGKGIKGGCGGTADIAVAEGDGRGTGGTESSSGFGAGGPTRSRDQGRQEETAAFAGRSKLVG